MTVERRSRKPLQTVRRGPVRAARDRRGRGVPASAGVILIMVTNASAVRRQVGFDGWSGAFLSFVTSIKAHIGHGRISHFAWDTACLVFDAITDDDLKTSFAKLARLATAPTPHDHDAPMLAFIAGAAMGSDEIDAFDRAEQALAEAKRRGHSVMSQDTPAPPVRQAVDLVSDLACAVARDEFFMVYQPKVHMRQRKVSSAEALIRWQHPVLGLVMPDAFINLADASGEMRAITLWTLRRVMADQRRLAAADHCMKIFINISGGLLTDRIFIDAACALVAQSGADIGFEITETAVIRDPDLAIANLEHCAAMGITLAIDDYGSGLSSLSYLKRLPATELKIDKMFVTHLPSSHRDPLIVRSTIDLAHALGMEVTAEGVETPAALALLTVMGCEMVQGYLISPPLDREAFEIYLDAFRFEELQTGVEPTVYRPASFWKRA